MIRFLFFCYGQEQTTHYILVDRSASPFVKYMIGHDGAGRPRSHSCLILGCKVQTLLRSIFHVSLVAACVIIQPRSGYGPERAYKRP